VALLSVQRGSVALALGLAAALANLAGGRLVLWRQWSRQFLKYFVALGAGFMLATAFLEMIPESVRLAPPGAPVFLLILGGYLLVHFFEHTIAPHFHFGEETHAAEISHAHASWTVLMGLAIHTFFDGVAIASGVLVSTGLGVLIFFAVFLHKLPEGFTVSSIMLASGRGRRAAFAACALLAASTLAGTAMMLVLRGTIAYALPFSAGVTIYVAASDLIPEVNHDPAPGSALVVFLGALIMLLLRAIFHL
jgi:ZIP family zinc transporter/zinc and cadmium transporter